MAASEEQDSLLLQKMRDRGRRRAVSASTHSTNSQFQPPFFPKSEAELSRISSVISRCLLFKHLDIEEQKTVISAMFEVSVPAGTKIIEQGAEGDNFYIIDEGTCEIYVGSTLVKVCKESDSFGELALMYDAPRAATVVAKTACRLWAMDRDTYKHLMMRNVESKRSLYWKFLSGVDFLSPLSQLEKSKVADFLEPRSYAPGEVIVRQGDLGDEFFIVAEGKVACTQKYSEPSTGEEKQGLLCELNAGQYFGEISLIKGTPRRATVTAVLPTKCLVLRAETFTLSMGPLLDYLNRNIAIYEDFTARLTRDQQQHA